ncbi:hypothetical protein H4S02_001677 [Coemansia sp. RSA 2611]|nr:hypothetical protein H4S02_001677 [Coemansia sp. RSA 2611]KAJ2719969.1 hypothetical protein H4R23_004778 [Coemansia sp. Cherry 401B]
MLPQVKVGVGCFVVRRVAGATQFLLGERHGGLSPGLWGLPGGHLEFGEQWSDCAQRETHEECGVNIADWRHVATTNDIFENSHYVTVFMKAEFDAERMRVKLAEPHKCKQWIWVSWEELCRRQSTLRNACTSKTSDLASVEFSPFHSLQSLQTLYANKYPPWLQ